MRARLSRSALSLRICSLISGLQWAFCGDLRGRGMPLCRQAATFARQGISAFLCVATERKRRKGVARKTIIAASMVAGKAPDTKTP
jgi:hypothetical protein